VTALAGRGVVVVGSGGVGTGIAVAMGEAGARVLVADIDPAAAQRAAAAVAATGARAAAAVADATDRESLAALAERAVAEGARAGGGPHVLVTTVAAITDRRLDACSEADWAWIIEANLMTVVRAVDVFLPVLRASGGRAHVVITTSLAGLVATPAATLRGGLRNGLYTTTKHALVGYADMLRHELGEEGIGVTLLAPGVVEGNLRTTSARLRPARHGGPLPDPQAGMEPKRSPMPGVDVGRLVVGAVESDRFWVVTHPESVELVEARHRELLDAYNALGAPPTA
jgi:NAD(P)-dependent dehydrogenase (short-subunit alcohol dehydrogenase family)